MRVRYALEHPTLLYIFFYFLDKKKKKLIHFKIVSFLDAQKINVNLACWSLISSDKRVAKKKNKKRHLACTLIIMITPISTSFFLHLCEPFILYASYFITIGSSYSSLFLLREPNRMNKLTRIILIILIMINQDNFLIWY